MKRSIKSVVKFLLLVLLTILLTVIVFHSIRSPKDNRNYSSLKREEPVPSIDKKRNESIKKTRIKYNGKKIDWHDYDQMKKDLARTGTVLVHIL